MVTSEPFSLKRVWIRDPAEAPTVFLHTIPKQRFRNHGRGAYHRDEMMNLKNPHERISFYLVRTKIQFHVDNHLLKMGQDLSNSFFRTEY